MIPDRILVWTTRGYQNIENVHVGDRVISYNAARNCTEYDTVSAIHTEYVSTGLIGIKKVGLHCLMTPEHPLLVTNVYTKEVERIAAEDLFMRKLSKKKAVISNRMFEPYRRTQDIADVEWTARLAASSSRHSAPPLYNDAIWDVLKDLTAEEAQAWLTTYFGWNIMHPRLHYGKTTLLRSKFVRNMLYHVAPRAGVGTYWGPYKPRGNHNIYISAFSITLQRDIPISHRTSWCADRQNGIIYNISTKNGSFLARYLGGTFLMACDYT
jgi:hypothetical protein